MQLSGDTSKRLFVVIVEIYQNIEPFEPVELYLNDGLEMAGHSVMTLGERLCMVTEVS